MASPQDEVLAEAEVRAHGHERGDVGREIRLDRKEQSGDEHRPTLLLSAVHEQHETDTARNQGEQQMRHQRATMLCTFSACARRR